MIEYILDPERYFTPPRYDVGDVISQNDIMVILIANPVVSLIANALLRRAGNRRIRKSNLVARVILRVPPEQEASKGQVEARVRAKSQWTAFQIETDDIERIRFLEQSSLEPFRVGTHRVNG